MFQYNFCYCSIRIPPMPACLHGSFQYNFCYCSIGISTPISFAFLKFQYNFCYCSIIMLFIKVEIRLGFNTTFVTVLSPRIIQLLMECRVSIQLLLLFYLFQSFRLHIVTVFQYNFCYCSIRIFTGFLFYYITRYPLKIKIF